MTPPKRILFLSSHDSPVLDVVKDLTDTAPPANDNGSVAGLIHDWDVKTKYFEAKVPIWIDDVTDLDTWKSAFQTPEAQEVIKAVGAWVYCFPKQPDGQIPDFAKEVMKAITEDILAWKAPTTADDEESEGPDADVEGNYEFTCKLAVAIPPENDPGAHEPTSDEYERPENDCQDYSFEYIAYGDTGLSELGDKVGLERLKETLEMTVGSDVDDNGGEDDSLLKDLDSNPEIGADGIERAEVEWASELFGARAALHEYEAEVGAENAKPTPELPPSEQAEQVDTLDEMISKLSLLRERTAGLPEPERKRMAAQAVKRLMEEHPDI